MRLKDSGTEHSLNCGVLPQEVSEESMWPRDCYDILAKNVAAFCPSSKSLPEAKEKSFRLIALAEDILK